MTQFLPPNVRAKHGAYYYDVGRDEHGKRHWIKLCRISEGEHKLYAALARVTRPQVRTMNDLMDAYTAHGLVDLKPRTQKDYLQQMRAALRPAFGDMEPADVTPADIAEYLERAKIARKRVTGSRQIAVLSSVFEYGLRHRLCEQNPCRGVRRNKVRPRQRYVRDDEFLALFNSTSEAMQDFLALALLTGLRVSDLKALRKSQVTPDGLRIEESKTGKLRIVAWSDAVRYFILRAQSRFPSSPYVLTNTQGDPWTTWGLASAMRRARPKANGEAFTLHDLRAKAESDHKTGLGLLPLYKRARRVTPVR